MHLAGVKSVKPGRRSMGEVRPDKRHFLRDGDTAIPKGVFS